MGRNNKNIIYQAENGALELRQDLSNETVWARLDDIALLFGRNKSVISRHIKNILNEQELDTHSTVAYFATVQKEGAREVSRRIEHFNLDMILSVGYRVNGKMATQFRKWATQTLKEHMTRGFTIHTTRIHHNRASFLQAVENIKSLAEDTHLQTQDIVEIIRVFSYTWFSLDRYDKNSFPTKGTRREITITAQELQRDIEKLKKGLIEKKEATELFAQEKEKDSLRGIVGNVFQSAFGKDMYTTIEEKAAHLFYFIVKNHPFNDGNKRSGAFAFIWFLQKAGFNFQKNIQPETLATLTILIAESNPKDKEKMVGVILLLLNRQ